MAMAKVTRIKDSTIVMFNMCIPSQWYWKLIFQWAKTTMKSISFETYIYIYIYVTYITLHYIRMRRATMHVCAWCLPYMRITLMRFFPVYFLHIQNKKSTLGLPMWGVGKTNPDPRANASSSRHICTIAIGAKYHLLPLQIWKTSEIVARSGRSCQSSGTSRWFTLDLEDYTRHQDSTCATNSACTASTNYYWNW